MSSAAFTLTSALAVGVIGQITARAMRIPGIILLLCIGVLLGPDVLNFINPDEMGETLPMIIGMAVAIILFEGGLHLDQEHMTREGYVLRRLLTLGAAITAIGGTLVAMLILGWGFKVSFMFGALIIVTGPTVVTPLLRRIKVKQNLQTILESEGVLIDPIGAIFAIVALDVVIAFSGESLFFGLVSLVGKMLLGIVIGGAGGYAIGSLLKSRKMVPDELENILTLALVLFIFELSNVISHESGIMTVTVAGYVVGHMSIPKERRLLEFKEQLTTMLIGMLFILLAADVRLADVWALGVPGFLVVLAVMFIVRPINIFACAFRSNLNFREKLFLSWLAPRGIIAAAVASLFAADLQAAGIDGGVELRSLVFAVIAMTVLAQGLTASPLARLLGLKRLANQGYIFIGSNPLSVIIADIIKQNGEEVVCIDRNPFAVRRMERIGVTTILGDASNETVLLEGQISSRRGVISTLENTGVNLILAETVANLGMSAKCAYMLLPSDSGISGDQLSERSQLLFGAPTDFVFWSLSIRKRRTVVIPMQVSCEEPVKLGLGDADTIFSCQRSDVLFLAAKRAGNIEPAFRGMELKNGHQVWLLVEVGAENLIRECEQLQVIESAEPESQIDS